jgi:hypothetical protein
MSTSADVLRCSSCNGGIIWAKTISGKKMPIDAAPVSHGNIALEETREGLVAHVMSTKALQDANCERYVSHFATCRDATQHRRPR